MKELITIMSDGRVMCGAYSSAHKFYNLSDPIELKFFVDDINEAIPDKEEIQESSYEIGREDGYTDGYEAGSDDKENEIDRLEEENREMISEIKNRLEINVSLIQDRIAQPLMNRGLTAKETQEILNLIKEYSTEKS